MKIPRVENATPSSFLRSSRFSFQPWRHSAAIERSSDDRRCALDHLYQRICDDLDALLKAVGLKVAA